MATLYRRADTRVYYVQFTYGGRRRRERVGTSRRDALRRLHEVELALLDGRVAEVATPDAPPHQEKPLSVSVGAFLADYLAWSKATVKEKTYRDDHLPRLTRFVHWLGEGAPGAKPAERFAGAVAVALPLHEVTVRSIEAFKVYRLSSATLGGSSNPTISPTTVWNELKTVSAFLQKAVDWEVLERNPAKSVRKPTLLKKQPRFLSQVQIGALLQASVGSRTRGVAALGIYAGLRKQEIAWLEWRDVDFDAGVLHVRPKTGWSPKNSSSRTIPLHSALAGILGALDRQSRWVVCSRDGAQYRNNMLRDLKQVGRKAEIHRCGLHLLRHTFASQLVIAGVSIYKVSQWLGHASIKTTMIYAHLAARDEDIEQI
ncbi:site-specific integrase [Planctomycetota bacterium]|nr:site-specific integrase [Planctomycetota bacterium]